MHCRVDILNSDPIPLLKLNTVYAMGGQEIRYAVSRSGRVLPARRNASEGFSLIEMLIAMLILTFGLLAAGQLMYVAMSSASLARSKGNATVMAQQRLEYLADLFRQDPTAADLTTGDHGPQQVQMTNPLNGTILNRYNVSWSVSIVPDPRPGKVLSAKLVTVTVTPISLAGSINKKAALNKVVSITEILSARTE